MAVVTPTNAVRRCSSSTNVSFQSVWLLSAVRDAEGEEARSSTTYVINTAMAMKYVQCLAVRCGLYMFLFPTMSGNVTAVTVLKFPDRVVPVSTYTTQS